MSEKQVINDREAAPAFRDHYRAAVLDLRASLTRILLSVGADPARPQDVARRFKLNKNLTWMISKIVNMADVYAVAQHVPGPARIDSLLTAMTRGGAAPEAVEKLQTAFRAFDEMVELHTGDRATLELMVSEFSPKDVQRDQLLNSRKLAFRGNSGTLGVMAKVHMGCSIVAPNAADPSRADVVQIAGLYGFRRLRSSASWPLFRRVRWEDDGTPTPDAADDYFLTDSSGVPLITEFCSSPVPDLKIVQQSGDIVYELPPGPVGKTATMTCVYGSVLRATGSLFRDEHNEFMELGCNLVTPAETLVADLLVHESMLWARDPDVRMFSRMVAGPEHSSPARETHRMVVTETVADLGQGIAGMITPHLPRQVELMQFVFEHVGWNPDAFHATRFVMPYPPIPATVLMCSRLPDRP
jgi:hypothetical protein